MNRFSMTQRMGPVGTMILSVVLMFISTQLLAKNSLSLSNVTASPSVILAGSTSSVKVRFALSEPAHVELKIYDARDYLIRIIKTAGMLKKGENTLIWDGKTKANTAAPPEAYYYTLTATNKQGHQVIYDLTDKTGGKAYFGLKAEYNPQTRQISYALPASSRVFLRVGIEGGNIYGNILNGVIRQAGKQTQNWDGWDQSRVVKLGKHPKLKIYIEGIQLGDNAIIVEDKQYTSPEYLPLEKTAIVLREKGRKPVNSSYHLQHNREQCRDFPLLLTLPDNLPRTEEGLPIISGKTPFRMNLEDKDIAMLESQRFEVMYYLNNKLLYENEFSYTPYTWIWDPKTLSGGTHYMTAVVVGFSGHYGIATIKFKLASNKNSNSN